MSVIIPSPSTLLRLNAMKVIHGPRLPMTIAMLATIAATRFGRYYGTSVRSTVVG
jgi:hypothetical protein